MSQLQNVVMSIALLPACLVPLAHAQAPTTASPTAAPVAYASVSELNGIIAQLRQTSQNTQVDLAKTRIDKWKTDSSTKRQVQNNLESVQRNLQAAMPEILTNLEAAPEDLAATFKLYRNLDALYDVFGTVVESAGAFGSKDELQSLGNDLSAFENARRALGERIQNLASAKEAELAQLRGQIKAMQAAAAPPAPVKKIVVDDTEPPKKPPVKKKAKPATPATGTPAAPAKTPVPTPAKPQSAPQGA